MIKILANGCQPNLSTDEPRLELIKFSRDGLRGNDFKTFVKRAGTKMAYAVRDIPLSPGEALIHGIALGATEAYGLNRNGDGFKEATCRDYHDTFVKHAHWYHNHQNKDPRKSYGHIKHSDYNEDMRRIELLAVLYGTKEAADRHNALVAEEELEALHAGRDIPTSMACKVAYDVCNGCGNKARNRSEYCTGEDEGGFCKRGGVKNNMCMVHDDGFMNGVDNPRPVFFDWSKVYRGADRTSWADGLVKSASGLLIGGAELAERLGLELPPYLFDAGNPWPTKLEKLAAKLAQLEIECESDKAGEYDPALSPELCPETDWIKYAGDTRQAIAALAMQKIALPVKQWMELVHNSHSWATPEMVIDGLPGVYGRMISDGSIKEASAIMPELTTWVPFETQRWASSLAQDFSLDRLALAHRVKRAALYGVTKPTVNKGSLTKTAGAAEPLARAYALYKLAVLSSLANKDEDFELTCKMAIRQNYVC